MSDLHGDPRRWFEHLPKESDYRILDVVRIGENRELAFAYSLQ